MLNRAVNLLHAHRMNYDYHIQRGCSLPEGCKDLIDVLRLAQETERKEAAFITMLPNAPFEDLTAEYEHLAQLDREWREYFQRQNG
jgi:hypothetical protein